MGFPENVPAMDQVHPTMKSPSMSPAKNGIARLCVFIPPYLRMINLAVQLMKIGNHVTVSPQLLDTAYAAG